jgi:hypothetical protein
MYPSEIRKQAESLRKSGKTYGEIQSVIGLPIPKSTLSDWCNTIELSGLEKVRLEANQLKNSERGRFIAHAITRKRRQEYLDSVQQRAVHLPELLKDKNVAKIALGMLYLGEGSKGFRRAKAEFCNSDPAIIRLYLKLLRFCYALDEDKFRCTVLCRADQDVKELERFWLETTQIPKSKLYPTRIDPRTVGKVSRKPEYKGVCVITYLSADLYHELMSIGRTIAKGP